MSAYRSVGLHLYRLITHPMINLHVTNNILPTNGSLLDQLTGRMNDVDMKLKYQCIVDDIQTTSTNIFSQHLLTVLFFKRI